MPRLTLLLAGLCVALAASGAAQSPSRASVQLETSNTHASLRGIHTAGPGVAWASGTNGTVLRTEDAGFVWQGCSLPPGGQKLDFRAIWAWDAMSAIVLSSGPGDQSRLYKTSDGCATWKLLLTNSERGGFWDALVFSDRRNGYLLGDPVSGSLVLMRTADGGEHWTPVPTGSLRVSANSPEHAPGPAIGIFAASNSSLALAPAPVGPLASPWLVTGATPGDGPYFLRGEIAYCSVIAGNQPAPSCPPHYHFLRSILPLAAGTESAGAFSLALRTPQSLVAVGGDYRKPSERAGTAAWSSDGGEHWKAAATPPRGYRSAVAWDNQSRAWIAVGPTGADLSRDDGGAWQPLDNGAWNALSPPYLVGPDGRIGKLLPLPAATPPAPAH